MNEPYYQPPPPGPAGPPGAYPPMRTEGVSKGYVIMVIIGLVILLVGGIIIASEGFLNDPYQNDYDDLDDYQKEREDYFDTLRTMDAIGNLIQYIGLIPLSIGLIYGAVRDSRISPNIRLGMLITMGIIVGLKISSDLFPYYLSLGI